MHRTPVPSHPGRAKPLSGRPPSFDGVETASRPGARVAAGGAMAGAVEGRIAVEQ